MKTMLKKGITKEKIFQAAIELIVEKGYDRFSIRELASRLDVKAASLYSHVKNVEEICIAVGENAIGQLSEVLEKAINYEDADTAFVSFAHTYRNFAHENPQLYCAIMALPKADEKELKEDEQKTIRPLKKLVGRYVVTEADIINYQRFIRSALHGFIMLESAGFMRSEKIEADESYDMLVQACLHEIKDEKLSVIPSDRK